ncbi:MULTISPECIES: hypothetical protein [Streptomyces]|nr:hypothetical protein [Streptomyces sp. A0592]
MTDNPSDEGGWQKRIWKYVKAAFVWLTLQGLATLLRRLFDDAL